MIYVVLYTYLHDATLIASCFFFFVIQDYFLYLNVLCLFFVRLHGAAYVCHSIVDDKISACIINLYASTSYLLLRVLLLFIFRICLSTE